MKWAFVIFSLMTCACSTGSSMNTVNKVDIPQFMGKWYVLAGRFTFLEVDVHNGVESYTWNEKENRIDIDFTYRQGGFDGKEKSVPQKGWIYNQNSGAHWKVSPLWPLKFDYLVVALDDNYQWTAIGVPDQKYLWIMARDWKNPKPIIESAVRALTEKGYDAGHLVTVPHQWPQ